MTCPVGAGTFLAPKFTNRGTIVRRVLLGLAGRAENESRGPQSGQRQGSNSCGEQISEDCGFVATLIQTPSLRPARGLSFRVTNAPSHQHYRTMPAVDVHRDIRLDFNYASLWR
jgi:hypothetical protein